MAYNSYLCGCYYYGSETSPFQPFAKQCLPLRNSEANSTLLSTTSRTILKQTFTNPSSDLTIKQCFYTFPLYDEVTVVGFSCKIGSRTLFGIVKEKLKATEVCSSSSDQRRAASILEQSPAAGDVFFTKLGNIPAGGSVIVKITYIGGLKHH